MYVTKALVVATLVGLFVLAEGEGPWKHAFSLRVPPADSSSSDATQKPIDNPGCEVGAPAPRD
jgi:hypothetical protein